MVRACAKPGPLMRSASNLTLSPTFTCLSMAGSWTRKTMVMPSFISSFLIGPCLRVILPTDFVDLSHLTVDHGSLGHGYRREYRARENENACRNEGYLAHGLSPLVCTHAPHLTMIRPNMPFS